VRAARGGGESHRAIGHTVGRGARSGELAAGDGAAQVEGEAITGIGRDHRHGGGERVDFRNAAAHGALARHRTPQ
jgi:hypothetical protein